MPTLKAIRTRLDIPQRLLAAKLDVTQGQISQWERTPDMLLSTLRAYVDALGGSLILQVKIDGKSFPLQMPDRD